MTSRSVGLFLVLMLLIVVVSAARDAKWQEKQAQDRVPRVPGRQAFHTVLAQHAGYVTVSEQRGAALFYRFFEADEDPSSKPLVL